MKSLKITEAANRRTDNTIAKRKKKQKGQSTIYKTLQRKRKIELHEPH